jgi:hypothetical protein
MSDHTKTALLYISATVLAAALVYLLCTGLARGAEPLQCDLTYHLSPGEAERCLDHISVPKDYLADLIKAADERDAYRAKYESVQQQLSAQTIKYGALLADSALALKECEARKVPPRCPEPGVWARPEVAWPVGLGLGFVGGFITGHWGVPR